MKFAENLKTLRLEQGLTQEQLANAIQVSQSTIHLWENGKTDVSGFYLIKLSQVLKVSADELLGIETLPHRTDITNNILGMLATMNDKELEICQDLISTIYKRI
ncbi:MAG: helix-turn-helix transcriptional regulator [Clostridia bacterium]|nr:helix-turn-helix transcriptional regulator [Clostridia bacterium]